MVDFNIKLTRRRVLASILVIGLATAAAGVGTFALFSDEATDSDNTISAGEMTLTVENGFSATDLYPTQSTGNKSINLTYTDGPDAVLNITDVSTANSSGLDWDSHLSVDQAYVLVGETVVTDLGQQNSLSGLEEDNVATLEQNDEIEFIVDVQLDGSAGNDFQGENVDLSVTFNASQQTE